MKLWDTMKRKFFAAGYDGAEDTRRHRDLPWSRRTARDEDSLIGSYDRDKLRIRCANLRRNNTIVAGVVERFSDNVVGTGIMPQAKTTDPKWNDEAEAFFKEWAKVSDLRKRVDFREIQRLIVQQRLLAGDVGFVMTSGGQLQPIESERIATPNKLEGKESVVDGVKIDPKTGITLGYYVFGRDNTGKVDTSTSNYDFIPRENFVFCMKPHRFDMVRGVPELAPVVNDIQYIHELQQATLEKAKMDAFNAWVVKRESYSGPGNLGPRNSATSVNSQSWENFETGRTHYLMPGEDVASLASNTPNPQYMEFIRMSLRLCGSALCLPYEFILLDFSQGSYSSSRAALLQTYRTFTDWQTWLTTCFLQRIWNWRIAKAVKEGVIAPAPLDDKGISQWYRCEWSFPEFGWVDPQNEAQANLLEWQLCTNTVTQMNRKKGRDVEDVMREKGMELAFADRIAQEVNTAQGTSFTWRDIISAQIPGQAPAASVPMVQGKPAMDDEEARIEDEAN